MTHGKLKNRVGNEDQSRSQSAEESHGAIGSQDVENSLPHAELLLDDLARGRSRKGRLRSNRRTHSLASLENAAGQLCGRFSLPEVDVR